MKEHFKDVRFREASRIQIEQANEIIEAYQADSIQLTLRQLYYQFVSRNWLANTERSYKNLSALISDARLAGLVDWSAIDDLGRVPSIPGYYEDREAFLRMLRSKAETGYVLDHWKGQGYYVELWVEKQALSSVLEPIASKWQIGFTMNKGYSSQTAMYDASKRLIEAREAGKDPVILYAGDLDPSGEDMVRDIRDRMEVFGAPVEVEKIALTFEQVKQYRCPPNPAKGSDPRFADFAAKYGDESWELDALEPKTLRGIAEKAIKSYCDVPMLTKQIEREARETKELTAKLAKL